MRISTSKGRMHAEEALGKFKKGLLGDNYEFLIGVFRRLPLAQREIAAEMVADAARLYPLKFYTRPFLSLCKAASHLRKIPEMFGYKLVSTDSGSSGNYVFPQRFKRYGIILLSIRNTGRHLYGSDRNPRYHDHPLLSYRRFSGNGDQAGSVWLQHLGHEYGTYGGSANVIVSADNTRWTLCIEPGQGYCLVLFEGKQYLLSSK